uniref:Secreted protein n=1 Tax=Octopus bimaculoides TaxID=37653 RepID=A0A0L8HR89_OCTBM
MALFKHFCLCIVFVDVARRCFRCCQIQRKLEDRVCFPVTGRSVVAILDKATTNAIPLCCLTLVRSFVTNVFPIPQVHP